MKTSHFIPRVLLLLLTLLSASSRLAAQPQTVDWNVAVLDQILAAANPGQPLVQVGDMQILVTNLRAWRDQLAGAPTKDSAFSGDVPTWTGGNVYYAFATASTNDVPPNLQKAFLDAANEWATFANIHFIPRTTQPNYVTVQVAAGLEGGQSAVGMVGGQQFFSIGPGAWNRGTLCHEIGHTLGLVHEHQRSDRDSYVTILSNNVASGGIGNFVLLGDSRNQGPYDFLSVMHYARNYLSVDPATLDTIVPLPAYTTFINLMGEPGPVVLSDGDRAGMAGVYGAGPAISAVVTNTQDSGPGSLRAALYVAYDHPGTHITFNIPTSDPGYTNGVFTIQPTDQLPWLVNATFLDGTSQPTNAQSNTNGPTIHINGALAPRPDTYPNGLQFGGTNCRAQSLVINGFSASGILVTNATSNTISGCYLALDPSGTVAISNGLPALTISSSATGASTGNIIGGTNAAARNVISGSAFQGIILLGTGTSANVVEGNFIGLNATGTAALSNEWEGIEIAGGARGNFIGGAAAAQRNVISGNGLQGVLIADANTAGNIVAGNYIGVDPSGTVAIPNSVGVNIINGAQGNLIGGSAPGAGNVISGNAYQGVSLQDSGTTGNLVQGNWIGINATGTSAVPNQYAGVGIYAPAASNIIGGAVAGARNVISGNGEQGVAIGYSGATGNIVEGNYIGLNPAGEFAIPNTWSGVNIFGGAQGNLIGGTTPGAGNIISGNSIQGISFQDAGTSGNLVEGNWIGLDVTGKSSISNAASGIEIFSGAQSNVIGGTLPAAVNIISGNAADGIVMDEPGTSGNLVEGNWIGLDATGASALPNAYSGVEFFNGAQGNSVGALGGRNFISGNTLDGVLVDDGAFANIVQGNTIGLAVNNTTAIPNGQAGVGMFGNATSNLVGGTMPGAANLIADNLGGGITLYYADTTNNALRGNSIFGNNGIGIGLYQDANQSGSESAPVLASAVAGTNTMISGTLTGSANATLQLDFYASPPPADEAQANIYVGTAPLTIGPGGMASFTNRVATSVPIGHVITATATDSAGNTSALSAGIVVTGSNPTNAVSKPVIGGIMKSGSAISVDFVSVEGLVYRLEFSDNLANTNWSILADQILGTGVTIELTDPGVAKLPERFYRLGVLP